MALAVAFAPIKLWLQPAGTASEPAVIMKELVAGVTHIEIGVDTLFEPAKGMVSLQGVFVPAAQTTGAKLRWGIGQAKQAILLIGDLAFCALAF